MSNYNDVHLSQDEMVGTAGMVPRALLDHQGHQGNQGNQGHQEYQVGEIQNHNFFFLQDLKLL